MSIDEDYDCPECSGEGSLACGSCAGSGEGRYDGSRCYSCGGGGEEPCENCEGTGRIGYVEYIEYLETQVARLERKIHEHTL